MYEIEYPLNNGGRAFYLYARKHTGEYKLVSTKNALFTSKDKQIESLLSMLTDKEEIADRFATEVSNNLDTVTRCIKGI